MPHDLIAAKLAEGEAALDTMIECALQNLLAECDCDDPRARVILRAHHLRLARWRTEKLNELEGLLRRAAGLLH